MWQSMKLRNNINFLFLLLQSLIAAISCIGCAFISPILLRFEYGAYEIGVAMTVAALASAVIKPLWGYLHDKLSCSRQIVLIATAAGCMFYSLLILSNGAKGIVEIAVMGLYMTIMSMISLVDAWAMRLISEGYSLNYGITRSGGSFSYAVAGILFGFVMSHFGIKPGIGIIIVLFIMQSIVSFFIPNPSRPPIAVIKPRLEDGARQLVQNKPYILLLVIYFLSAIAMCSTESFFAVRIKDLGGTEEHVGIGLFLQAISEIPIMFFFTKIKKRLHKGPEFFIALSLVFCGLKCIGIGIAPTYQLALAVTLINGLAFGFFILASVDYILKYVPENLLATAYLVSSSLGSSLGAVAGNYINGIIAEQTGAGMMMIITSSFAFLSALLIVFFSKPNITGLVKGA